MDAKLLIQSLSSEPSNLHKILELPWFDILASSLPPPSPPPLLPPPSWPESVPSPENPLCLLVSKVTALSRPSQIKSVSSLFASLLALPPPLPLKDIPITIDNIAFSSESSIKSYVLDIMKKYKEGENLDPPDTSFMMSLLQYHPVAGQKLMNVKDILVSTHQKRTRCFAIRSEDLSVNDISYIKAYNNLLNISYKTNITNIQSLLVSSFTKLIDKNPTYRSFCIHTLLEKFPHCSRPKEILSYASSNLCSIYNLSPSKNKEILVTLVRLIIDLEDSDDLHKLDALLSLILRNANIPVETLVEIFNQEIVLVHKTKYVQLLVLFFCLNSSNNTQLFLTSLVTNIYQNNYVEASASYIVSFLSRYEGDVILTAKYLIYYCLKNLKTSMATKSSQHVKDSKQFSNRTEHTDSIMNCEDQKDSESSTNPRSSIQIKSSEQFSHSKEVRELRKYNKNGICVLKYLLILISYRNEILENTKCAPKLLKLFRKEFLDGIGVSHDLDYSFIEKMTGHKFRLCKDNLYLPFHLDFSSLNETSEVLGLGLGRKKRHRTGSQEITTSRSDSGSHDTSCPSTIA